MSKNTGIPYETLTQQIFQEILKQDSVQTIDVKHDVLLQGKTLKHQIDVYWEFTVGGITYRTVIQAKDWASKVKQEHILSFKSVLEDLPGQARGIFVTRTGYQKGALEFSRANDILLYELRQPTEKDWEGKIKTIIIHIHALIPRVTEHNLVPDLKWVKERKEELGLGEDEKITFKINGLSNELFLYDENNNVLCSIKNITDTLISSVNAELPPTRKIHIFNEPTFIHTEGSTLPMMKLHSLEVTLSMSKHEQEIHIDGGSIIGYILKDVLNGQEKTFNHTIQLLKPKN